MNAVAQTVAAEPMSGVEIFVPLAKLKKSPRNARKVPHGEAAIEALAASIKHKGLIQNLVVEPEVKEDGTPTGAYFVTAGEGRRRCLPGRHGGAGSGPERRPQSVRGRRAKPLRRHPGGRAGPIRGRGRRRGDAARGGLRRVRATAPGAIAGDA